MLCGLGEVVKYCFVIAHRPSPIAVATGGFVVIDPSRPMLYSEVRQRGEGQIGSGDPMRYHRWSPEWSVRPQAWCDRMPPPSR